MFSRPFIQSAKEINDGIAARANPTRESVRRSPACGDERSYTYAHPGFRVFQAIQANTEIAYAYSENLIADFRQVYELGNSTLPYHAAVTALHHNTASLAVTKHLSQLKNVILLIHATTPRDAFNTAELLPFKTRRLVLQFYQYQAIRIIQRPLTDASLCIAHATVRAQVTEISALKLYQRHRLTATASFAALLAIRFSAERGYTKDVATILHHRMIQYIIRRATGSMARAVHTSEPYIKHKNVFNSIPLDRVRELEDDVKARFASNPQLADICNSLNPTNHKNCCFGGPVAFHTAKYYAKACLELIGDRTADSESEERWTYLDAQVARVRRGEVGTHTVIESSKYDNWAFAIQWTYVSAVRNFLAAIDAWRIVGDNVSRSGWHNPISKIWRGSCIRKDSPVYVQTVQMVHEMYRFIFCASVVISPQYMGVFGFSQHYVNTLVQRTKHLSYNDGDETSSLMFAFLLPSMMTPDIHIDTFVQGHVFQNSRLYVKMSDPIFGPLKKKYNDMIPSRHTGTINRATLMQEPVKRYR
jgi:hypothetical protein